MTQEKLSSAPYNFGIISLLTKTKHKTAQIAEAKSNDKSDKASSNDDINTHEFHKYFECQYNWQTL